jgi:steroid delta-isomerase-like uncharacterized protein
MKNQSESARVLHRWFEEVWNQGREEAIDELFAADGIAHGLLDESGEELRGPGGFKPFFRKFKEAFPDMQVIIEDCICEDDQAAARCTIRAQHTGKGFGVAATNNAVEFSGICIVRVEGGKIREAWNNFDFRSLNRHIGAL